MKNYLTAKEIFRKYPYIEKKLKWGKRDLVFFTRVKILEGKHHKNRQVSVIDENSLLQLLKFMQVNLKLNAK